MFNPTHPGNKSSRTFKHNKKGTKIYSHWQTFLAILPYSRFMWIHRMDIAADRNIIILNSPCHEDCMCLLTYIQSLQFFDNFTTRPNFKSMRKSR